VPAVLWPAALDFSATVIAMPVVVTAANVPSRFLRFIFLSISCASFEVTVGLLKPQQGEEIIHIMHISGRSRLCAGTRQHTLKIGHRGKKFHCIRMFRVGKHIFGSPLFDNAPLLHHQHTIGDGSDH